MGEWVGGGVGGWMWNPHACMHVHKHKHVKHAEHDTHETGHWQFFKTLQSIADRSQIMYAHTYVYMHRHVHTHKHVKRAKHDTHETGHLQFLNMYLLACTCMHVTDGGQGISTKAVC